MKRPTIDLAALTAEVAEPMQEATQRVATPQAPAKKARPAAAEVEAVKTANLENLAFKVPPTFRKRFRQRAVEADLKLNELLFECLSAWEKQKGIKP